MPRFSIIIPCRNAAATLPATLESLAAQTLPDWEALLVDDASTDATAALIAAAAAADPQPELHIYGDGDLAYRRVVEVMSDAARAGVTRIGFVTDPKQQ